MKRVKLMVRVYSVRTTAHHTKVLYAMDDLMVSVSVYTVIRAHPNTL